MDGASATAPRIPTANSAATLSQGASPPKKPPIITTTGTEDNQPNPDKSTFFTSVKKAKDYTEKYSPYIAWASLLTGLGNFAYINIKGAESWIANITTTALSKASLFVNGIFGLLQNVEEKNTIGLVGYGSDLITSVLAKSKNTYFLRFFGTALDQFTALLEDFSVKHPETIEAVYKQNPDQFMHFSSFGDSLKKSWTATRIVLTSTISEVYKTYKEEGIVAAIKDYFSTSRADGNILGSSLGVLASGAIGITGMATDSILIEKLGKTSRVVEGFHCDYGVAIKEFSINPKTGESSGKGNDAYGLSGKVYGLAGVLDLGNTWLEERGFHFASLGLDRFGAYLLAKAQAEGHKGRQSKLQALSN